MMRQGVWNPVEAALKREERQIAEGSRKEREDGGYESAHQIYLLHQSLDVVPSREISGKYPGSSC